MSVGIIREFNVKNGNWSAYVDRLQMYFIANKTAEDLKLPTLIALIGEEAYELLYTLASPRKPSSLTYLEAVELLQTHFQLKPSILSERFKFRKRSQLLGETIAEYVAELKKLSTYCYFDNLEENLRDQIIFGLRSERIRLKLFTVGNLDCNKTIELASALEAAEQSAEPVEGTTVEETSVSVVMSQETSHQSLRQYKGIESSSSGKCRKELRRVKLKRKGYKMLVPIMHQTKYQCKGKVYKGYFGTRSSNCETLPRLVRIQQVPRCCQTSDNRAEKGKRLQGMKAKTMKKPIQRVNPVQVPAFQQTTGAAVAASSYPTFSTARTPSLTSIPVASSAFLSTPNLAAALTSPLTSIASTASTGSSIPAALIASPTASSTLNTTAALTTTQASLNSISNAVPRPLSIPAVTSSVNPEISSNPTSSLASLLSFSTIATTTSPVSSSTSLRASDRTANMTTQRENPRSAKMLLFQEDRSIRLITFTLPRTSCTLQNILDQVVQVPISDNTHIQCRMNDDPNAEVLYYVSVGLKTRIEQLIQHELPEEYRGRTLRRTRRTTRSQRRVF